jgi:hypothetical protein
VPSEHLNGTAFGVTLVSSASVFGPWRFPCSLEALRPA